MEAPPTINCERAFVHITRATITEQILNIQVSMYEAVIDNDIEIQTNLSLTAVMLN